MSITNLPLMKAMAAKVDYLNRRQGVIAQNIANADTPGYQSQDMTKVDFGAMLKKASEPGRVTMAATDPGHMGPGNVKTARDVKDRLTYEVAPDSNGVILEEQMVKASQTQMDYNLLTGLMTKQVGLYKIAIGRQG